MLRLVVSVIVVGIVMVAPKVADACGVWHMQDVEKKTAIEWWINAGKISNEKTKATIGALYLDTEHKDGMRVIKDRKVLFDVVGGASGAGKLRKSGRQVATFDDKSITFGKRVYTFELSSAGDWHGMPSWKVTVKRGDVTVIESAQASALCAAAHAQSKTGSPLPEAAQLEEIRRRIMFYLAWRELGA